jgi:hypothetical protein
MSSTLQFKSGKKGRLSSQSTSLWLLTWLVLLQKLLNELFIIGVFARRWGTMGIPIFRSPFLWSKVHVAMLPFGLVSTLLFDL